MPSNALPLPRRPDVERAFAHLADTANGVDLTGIDDPQQQFVTSIRHFMETYGEVGARPSTAGVSFTTADAGGVPAQWVQAPNADPDYRLVYLHGGGWCSGRLEDYRSIAAALAELSGASLLLVDYRLSPEHRFPAGLEDCAKALAWAAETGPAGRGSARRLVLAGDSAGGNLAATTCLLMIQQGGRAPDRLVLIAGTLDNADSDERVGRDDPVCTPEGFRNCTDAYLSADVSSTEPLVSPVYASQADLRRFPPTLLQVSSAESLLYDSLRFAERLREVEVRHTLSVWPGLPHVWHAFLGLLPEARLALAEVATFLRSDEPGPR